MISKYTFKRATVELEFGKDIERLNAGLLLDVIGRRDQNDVIISFDFKKQNVDLPFSGSYENSKPTYHLKSGDIVIVDGVQLSSDPIERATAIMNFYL